MQVIDKMLNLLQAKTDAELAVKLGLKNASVVGSWRIRGKVPMKVIREWSQKYNKPIEWFSDDAETKKAELSTEDQDALDLFRKMDSRSRKLFMSDAYKRLSEQALSDVERD